MIRRVLTVVLALFLGGVFNMMLVTVSQNVYPFPENVDPNNLESLKTYVEANGMATGALLIVLAAHAGGSVVSGLICGIIAKRIWITAAVGMGIFWMCGGLMMLSILPSPVWFSVADTLLYVPAAIVGVMVGGHLFKPQTTEAVTGD
ncbi:MAG: hypothetical protein VYA84_18575 [Planctomycetota bacterium]|nr:hypothetical protein [Planctomycetota bacterium]